MIETPKNATMSWGKNGRAETTKKKKKTSPTQTPRRGSYAMKRNSHHGVKRTSGTRDIPPHTSPYLFQTRNILEIFPAILLVGFLGFHAERKAVGTNFILQTRDDASRDIIFFAFETVGGANHFGTFHGLSMPVVPVESAFQMGVTLSLEEIVVMLLLSKVVHVVVLAVIADLLEHDTHGVLKLPDHLHVFLTMVFMIGTHKFFLGQGTLKFGNPGSCFRR